MNNSTKADFLLEINDNNQYTEYCDVELRLDDLNNFDNESLHSFKISNTFAKIDPFSTNMHTFTSK